MIDWRKIFRWVLALAYFAVGVIHLRSPSAFMPIMPIWVPFPHTVILATGLCEVAGSVALLTSRLRRIAAIMLALYAVCVFPANIKHAWDYAVFGRGSLTWWYHAPRLAFQPVIIWWSLYVGDVIDWPFNRDRTGSRPS